MKFNLKNKSNKILIKIGLKKPKKPLYGIKRFTILSFNFIETTWIKRILFNVS